MNENATQTVGGLLTAEMLPAQPACETQEVTEPGAQFAPKYHDVLIFCHPHNANNLVRVFEKEISRAANMPPVFIVWAGTSGVLRLGVIAGMAGSSAS